MRNSDKSSVRRKTIFEMSAEISKFSIKIRVQLQEGKHLLRDQHQSTKISCKYRATLP
jgi:hypothetical protein